MRRRRLWFMTVSQKCGEPGALVVKENPETEETIETRSLTHAHGRVRAGRER